MSENTGRTVRLFLADGTPSELITAEIMNWTGHVLVGARTGLPRFLERPELDRTGIYFLSGRDPEDPDNATSACVLTGTAMTTSEACSRS